MIRTLLVLVRSLRRAWLFESVGATAVVAGVYLTAGVAWAVIAGGVALLLKGAEIDGDE
jgi:hypothetical protein